MPGQGCSACAEGVREPGTHRARLWAGAWAREPELHPSGVLASSDWCHCLSSRRDSLWAHVTRGIAGGDCWLFTAGR